MVETEPVIPDRGDEFALPAEEQAALDESQAELWRRGDPSFLLDETQQKAWDLYHSTKNRITVLEIARQTGKTFFLAVLSLSIGTKSPGKRSNYIARTSKQAAVVVVPTMLALIAQMPADIRPEWRPGAGIFQFPNGHELHLLGADDQPSCDRARGTTVVFTAVDEAAFIGTGDDDLLHYLVTSILIPQTRRTKGRIILSSTPPLSPGHSFCKFADGAANRGAYLHADFWSPGLQTVEEKNDYVREVAEAMDLTVDQLKATTFWQREFLALRVLDEALAVVFEFPKVKKDICVPHERPRFFDIYGSLDPGMSDFSGVLFAYWDFNERKLIIEHELLLVRANTATIATEIKKVLDENYKDMRPHSFVVDDPHGRLVADLMNDHKLNTWPAKKDDREAAISKMRVWIAGKKVLIHPRCKNLIRQLSNAIRKKPGGDMVRTAQDAHFDLVAALWYLIRSVNENKNPWPIGWGEEPHGRVGRNYPTDPKQQPTLNDWLRPKV